MIKIARTGAGFEKERLMAPFGFKGGYVTSTWQVSVYVESQTGEKGIGLGLQSVLWSDEQVFGKMKEAGGNAAMFLITQYAAERLEGMSFENPIQLLDEIFPAVYEYAKVVTGKKDLRKTFVLNALVPIDLTLWQLYAKEQGITDFDQMLPDFAKMALSCHQEKLAAIPLITYGMSVEEIRKEVEKGSFFLKIKIGCDPDGDKDPKKMLEWDKNRLTEIHWLLKDARTPYTENGKIPYYLDANGRYESKEQILELLEHAKKIHALDQIILLEEPFKEGSDIQVGDLPVRVAADESAHSDKDVAHLIELGYKECVVQ